MNVAQPIGLAGAPVQPAATLGSAGAPAISGVPVPIPGLFALQLEQLLSTVPQTPAAAQAAIGERPDEEVAADELAAMLLQWLQQAGLKPLESGAAASTAETAPLTTSFAAAGVVADREPVEPLTAMFMKTGMPRAEAEEAARFVSALLKGAEPLPQSEQPEWLRQVRAWLSARTDASQVTDTKPEKAEWPARLPLATTTRVPVESRETGESWQPLRIHRAIHAYQAETGMTANPEGRLAESAGRLKVVNAAEPQLADMTVEESVLPHAARPQSEPLFQQAAPVREMVRAARFVEDVQAFFVRQLKIETAPGLTQARLILMPQSLGQVEVTITSENGVITAQFTAETAAGKEVVDNQLSQLRAALVQQGIQVDKLVVNQETRQDQSWGSQDQRDGQASAQQDQQRQQQSRGQEPDTRFDELMEGRTDADSEFERWFRTPVWE